MDEVVGCSFHSYRWGPPIPVCFVTVQKSAWKSSLCKGVPQASRYLQSSRGRSAETSASVSSLSSNNSSFIPTLRFSLKSMCHCPCEEEMGAGQRQSGVSKVWLLWWPQWMTDREFRRNRRTINCCRYVKVNVARVRLMIGCLLKVKLIRKMLESHNLWIFWVSSLACITAVICKS
jgi:hypothetical protein